MFTPATAGGFNKGGSCQEDHRQYQPQDFKKKPPNDNQPEAFDSGNALKVDGRSRHMM
jgi:hypothetical protein